MDLPTRKRIFAGQTFVQYAPPPYCSFLFVPLKAAQNPRGKVTPITDHLDSVQKSKEGCDLGPWQPVVELSFLVMRHCRGKNIGADHFARWNAPKGRQASLTTSPSNQNHETTPHTNPCRPRGVPLPISLRMTRLRLNPLTCNSNRFRMFACPRKCKRLIPPVS